LSSITQFVLARWMGIDDYGLYTSVYTLLGPVIVIASLGLDTWLLRQGGNTATLGLAINQVFLIRLVLSLVLLLVAAPLLLTSKEPGLTLSLVVVAGLGLVFELLLLTANIALRAQIRNVAAALLQASAAMLLLGLILVLWNEHSSVLAIAGYRLITGIFGVMLLAWLLRRTLRVEWKPGKLRASIRQSRVYFMSDILSAVALKADLTLVALFLGTLAAGTYSPALTIINTTFLVPHVMWQVLLPVAVRQPVGSRRFKTLVRLALLGSVGYGLIWAGAFTFGAEQIVHLIYGEQYLGAVPLLRIMSLIPLLKSLNFCWVLIMVARDEQPLRTKLQAVGAGVNGLGNLAFIPFFGLVGAAWVNLGTEAVLVGCYAYGSWVALRRQARA
jgi:O-antigen/teichoic acid export membrane protein